MTKKKKKDTMSNVTLGGVIGLNVVGAIPTSTAPGSAGIKAGFASGVSKVGSTLPTIGKIKGTSMVLGATKGLTKKSKKLFPKTKNAL